jgi:hypothetical protein
VTLALPPAGAAIVAVAFGAVAGIVLVCAFLWAMKAAGLRSAGSAFLSLAATLLSLLLLLAAAAQLGRTQPVAMDLGELVRALKALGAFVSQGFFLGAAFAGAAIAFILSPARSDSADPETEEPGMAVAEG